VRLRTIKVDPLTDSNRHSSKDLDYLTVRLHARRSRMAEGGRLDDLCQIQNLPEFFRATFPESELKEVSDFQRLLVHELIRSWSGPHRLDTYPFSGRKYESFDPGISKTDPDGRNV